MTTGEEHIARMEQIAERLGKPGENFEINFGEVSVEFAKLIVSMSTTLDETQHRVRRLNVLLVILTIALIAMPFIERFILR